MSSKPSVAGASSALVKLEKLQALSLEIAELRKKKARLADAEDEYGRLHVELTKDLAAMDVTSPGNYGWEGRVVWFLVELLRQAREPKDASPASTPTPSVTNERDELFAARQALLSCGVIIGDLQTALERAITQLQKHNRSAGHITDEALLREWSVALDRSRAKPIANATDVPTPGDSPATGEGSHGRAATRL